MRPEAAAPCRPLVSTKSIAFATALPHGWQFGRDTSNALTPGIGLYRQYLFFEQQMPGTERPSRVTLEMVPVGDPGNPSHSRTGYGRVNYEYDISKYEITIQQYATFLNAVAASDPYGLYNPSMGTDLAIAGIARSGSSGSYSYSVINPSGSLPPGASSPGNRPIAYIDWFDAARFAN